MFQSTDRTARWERGLLGKKRFQTRMLGGQHQGMPNSTAPPSGAQYIGDTRCAVLCHPGFYPRLVSTGPGTLSDDSSSDGRSPYAQSLRLPHRMGFQVYLQVNFCPLWLLSTSPVGVSSGSHPHLQDGCCPVRVPAGFSSSCTLPGCPSGTTPRGFKMECP